MADGSADTADQVLAVEHSRAGRGSIGTNAGPKRVPLIDSVYFRRVVAADVGFRLKVLRRPTDVGSRLPRPIGSGWTLLRSVAAQPALVATAGLQEAGADALRPPRGDPRLLPAPGPLRGRRNYQRQPTLADPSRTRLPGSRIPDPQGPEEHRSEAPRGGRVNAGWPTNSGTDRDFRRAWEKATERREIRPC